MDERESCSVIFYKWMSLTMVALRIPLAAEQHERHASSASATPYVFRVGGSGLQTLVGRISCQENSSMKVGFCIGLAFGKWFTG